MQQIRPSPWLAWIQSSVKMALWILAHASWILLWDLHCWTQFESNFTGNQVCVFHIIAQIWLWPHSFRNGSGLLGLERLWLKEFFFLRLTYCSPLHYVLLLLRHTIYPFMAILLHLTSSRIFFGPVGTLTDYWQVGWQWYATCFCKRVNQSYMVIFTFFFLLVLLSG